MIFTTIIANILLFSYIFILPSYLAYLISNKKLNGFCHIFSYFFILYPFVIYYTLFFLQSLITTKSILLINTILVSVLVLMLFFKSKKLLNPLAKAKQNSKIKPHTKKFPFLLAVLLVVIFLFHFITFTFPDEERFSCADNWANKNLNFKYIVDYYNIGPTMEDIKIPINSRFDGFNYSELGLQYLDFESLDYYNIKRNNGSIADNYITHKSINDEPFGVAVHFSIFLELFNDIGIRIFHTFVFLLLSFFTYSLAALLTKKKSIGYLSIILINLNPLNFLSESFNPNFIASLILLIVIYLIVKYKNLPFKHMSLIIIAAISYGLLGSIRPIVIVFAPMIAYILYNKSDKKSMFIFFIITTLAVIPNLWINNILYSNLFQFPGFLLYPLFEHSFMGVKFYIRTLFNFPFYTHIIRSPGLPFPNLINIPLLFLKSLGILLFGAVFFGFKYIDKRKIRRFLIYAVFGFVIFLAINENWMVSKNSLILLVYPYVVIISLYGFTNLISRLDKQELIKYSIVIVCLLMLIIFVRNLDFEKDKRINTMDNQLESSYHISYLKTEMTQINLLPQLAGKKVDIMGLKDELENKRNLPKVFYFYGDCLPEGGIIAEDMLIMNSSEIYLIFSHIYKKHIYGFKSIGEINISKTGESLKNIMSPSACFSTDLEIINENNTGKIIISQSSSTDVPKYVFDKIVKINIQDKDILRICIFEEDIELNCIWV